jgi:hypothetical protein
MLKKHWLTLLLALAGTAAAHAQNAVGELFSADAGVRGSVLLSGSGTHVLSGSQVSAGDGAALLKLERGGQLRICPRTNLSLSVDAGGRALVLGMNTGSMELNYELSSAADSLITPDFRLQLISPGNFHLAISVAPSGDTCLRSLPGNDAAVFVSELMGGGAYQLSPGKSVIFRAGKISGAAPAPPTCGCPEIAPALSLPRTPSAAAPLLPPVAETRLPPSRAAEPHLEVESSFVYRGNDAVPDDYLAVSRLRLSTDNSNLALALLPTVSGPAAQTRPAEKKEGILHRLGSLLQRLFPR